MKSAKPEIINYCFEDRCRFVVTFHSIPYLMSRTEILKLNHCYNLLCYSNYLTKSSKQRLSIFRLNSI